MPDLSTIASALPIGILFFLGTFVGWHRRRSGHRRALRELPRLAERLGLERFGARQRGTIGKMRGVVEGYEVFVDPDERSRLVVRFDSAPGIDCRSYVRGKRPPRGLEPFDSRSKAFDRLFKERFARGDLADELEARRDALGRAAAEVARAMGPQRQELSILDEGIECVVDFGKPPYIPARVVEEGLRALTRLAKVVDESARAADSRARPASAAPPAS